MFQQRTEIAHTVYSHAFYRTKTRIRKECVTWPKNFEGNSWNFTVLSDNDRATVLVWSTSMNNVTLNIYLSHTFLPPAAQKSPARKAVSKSELPMDSIIIDHGLAYRTKYLGLSQNFVKGWTWQKQRQWSLTKKGWICIFNDCIHFLLNSCISFRGPLCFWPNRRRCFCWCSPRLSFIHPNP